jgi:hypothetical protein
VCPPPPRSREKGDNGKGSGNHQRATAAQLSRDRTRGDVTGGAGNYYKEVKVCSRCYHVYAILDRARDVLRAFPPLPEPLGTHGHVGPTAGPQDEMGFGGFVDKELVRVWGGWCGVGFVRKRGLVGVGVNWGCDGWICVGALWGG